MPSVIAVGRDAFVAEIKRLMRRVAALESITSGAPDGWVAGTSPLNNTQVIANSSTETFATGMSNVAFSTIAGRIYRIAAVVVVTNATAASVTVRIRDGAGSAPTTSSAVITGGQLAFSSSTVGQTATLIVSGWTPGNGDHNLGVSVRNPSAITTFTIGDGTFVSGITIEDIGST